MNIDRLLDASAAAETLRRAIVRGKIDRNTKAACLAGERPPASECS